MKDGYHAASSRIVPATAAKPLVLRARASKYELPGDHYSSQF